MITRVTVTCLLGLAFICALGPARAEDEDFATVVMVTGKEVVFDRGTKHGVKKGDKVRIYRLVTVHHPVTGEEITDRFALGTAKVAEASELLSIIRNTKKLSKPPQMGDLVQIVGPKKKGKPEPAPAPVPAPKPGEPQPAPKPAKPVSKASAEQKALGAAFIKSLGKPIDERILIYSRFLSRFPDGAYAKAATREIEWLEDIEDRIGGTAAGMACVEEPVAQPRILHPVVGPLEVGDDAQVVIAVLPPSAATSARLFIRRAGDEGYDEVAMKRDGAYYYRAHIPEKYTEKGGQLAYFIETAKGGAAPTPVVGWETKPKMITVEKPIVDKIVRKGRSVLRAWFEYVNFDMDDTVDDEYWSFEADFFYRIHTFLYGVRVGMGIFSGTGGRLAAIEESKANNEQVGAHYGFIEGEFEIVPLFHFMLRGLAGNERSPGDETDKMSGVFGFEGGIRIGEETKTNLALSGAIVTKVGYEARLALDIGVFRKVPVLIEGLVTNFPVEESHVGLRLVVGTGYRFTDWLAIFARGSWNARTIKHTGFGGGASLALSW
jgi:hypothetical protein